MQFETINTPRLTLRILTPDGHAYVMNRYNDDEIMAFFGFTASEDLDKERHRHNKGTTMFNKSFVIFHIIDNASGKVIGSCNYHTWYTEHNRAEIGYILTDETFRGKGIMGEALPPVLDYGFSTMNLHRVEALVGPTNEPSLKLIRKMGFQYEGHLREHYFKNGSMEDSLIFSLLKSEYLQQKRQNGL